MICSIATTIGNRLSRHPPGEIPQTSWNSWRKRLVYGNNWYINGSYYWCRDMAKGVDFESLVTRHYQPLYQFAFSLTRDEADACDLTQQTFCIWAAKGHQLRDETKVKTWLFTTLHREFLGARRKQIRFPQIELYHAASELPVVPPTSLNQLDTAQVLAVLALLDETYRAPVALFYLQDYSYVEIAEILEVPIGTVKSRLARGLDRLHQLLTKGTGNRPPPQPTD